MKPAMSLVEVILAVGLFVIFSTGVIGLLVGGMYSNRQAEEQVIATQYAAEGLDAVRSIRNQGYTFLNAAPTPTPPYGVTKVGNVWAWQNSINTFQKYTRNINVDRVYRNAQGAIVSAGALDPNTKKKLHLRLLGQLTLLNRGR